MKKYIIITSINKPTKAVIEFSKLNDWQLVVVGDKKTPKDWHYKNVIYLSPEDQEKLGFNILKLLPWNHYCRKMIGYLYAIKNGADIIIDTDDDNIPYINWDFPKLEGIFDNYAKNKNFINIYNDFTLAKIWPRGFPLEKIIDSRKYSSKIKKSKELSRIGIWQGLADEDPDVDAIYRLVDNTPCYFDKRNPIVLNEGTVCPFNSQNTLFIKEVFLLLYLPSFVTFRTTDILRGLIAQPILWSKKYKLGFTEATVIQKRNPHDYLKDFKSEIPLFINSQKILDISMESVDKSKKIEVNLVNIYKKLYKENLVEKKELDLLKAWILDINNLKNL